MAEGVEVKSIIFADHYIFMAHADSDPVRRWLFDFESHFFDVGTALKTGLHYGKFVTWTVCALYHQVWKDFYVWMLGDRRKFVTGLFPQLDVFSEVGHQVAKVC